MTTETRDLQQKWWSWLDVLKAAPNLGIPHFQRGMVWDSSNRVALLESMYEASPCGMFVVWRPDEAHAGGDIGVSILTELPMKRADVMWLVDGQQRSRSLVSIFRECVVAEESASKRPVLVPPEVLLELKQLLAGETVADEDQGEEPVDVDLPDAGSAPASDGPEDALPSGPEAGPPCWYVCIPALLSPTQGPDTWWRELATTARVRRFSPFRTFKESALDDARSVAPRGLLPLALFMAEETPFSVAKVDALIGLLETKNREELQRRAPWGPLWLTGQAKRWDETTEDVAPLLAWMKALRAETASARPLGTVLDRLSRLFTEQRFGVGELPRSDLPSAVDAYVRINRAGVRVQAEERAMAALLRWHPGLLDDLATFLRRRDGLEHGTASRAHLSHASDKTFGFGLWTQVVARYVVLQEFKNVGIRWLGPDVLEKWTVREGLEDSAEKPGGREALERGIRDAAQRASSALLFLDGVLSDELSLDHRMARSDVRQLWPLLEVLSRLPASQLDAMKSDAVAREAVARLLHVVMLRGYIDQADMLDLCVAIHREPLVGETLDAQLGPLLRCCVNKMAEQDRSKHSRSATPPPEAPLAALTQNALEVFKELVEASRSLQHPAVGWLYALERRGEARDCDWQHQRAAHLRSEQQRLKRGIKHLPDVSQRAPLAASMYGGAHPARPEKQHIVPFADARKITNKGGTRATASPANDIGNLTWISSLQNGLDYGFADRWMALDHPSDQENFKARGLLHPDASGKTASALFEELAVAVEDRGHKGALSTFERFCDVRREWMKSEMESWLNKPLSPEAMALLQP